MIIYDLCCDNDHPFEGWFKSAEDFTAQRERHLVNCPMCDSPVVRRMPSAVAIASHHEEETSGQKHATPKASVSNAMLPAGTQMLALYRQMVQTMISNCEDVGPAFADEARRIHLKEAPERPIRGDATEAECEALRDEGIAVLRIPTIKDEDLN